MQRHSVVFATVPVLNGYIVDAQEIASPTLLWRRGECSLYHSPVAGAIWHRSVVQTTAAWYISQA